METKTGAILSIAPVFVLSDLSLETKYAYAPNCTRLKAVTVNPLDTESKN